MLDRTREPVVPDGRLDPPYDLPGDVGEVWARVTDVLAAMKVASRADVDTIARYCEWVVIAQRAGTAAIEQSLLVQGSRSQVINKHVQVLERATNQVRSLANELGLTPAARTRIQVDPMALRPRPHLFAPSSDNPFDGTNLRPAHPDR
jgi:P27 family predicted phage terminase small subunit